METPVAYEILSGPVDALMRAAKTLDRLKKPFELVKLHLSGEETVGLKVSREVFHFLCGQGV